MTDPAPTVGIFWGIKESGKVVLVVDQTDLGAAEVDSEFINHPVGHYEFWEKIKREAPRALKARGWPIKLRNFEYEDWPRGRIIFERATDQFLVYADRKLLPPSSLREIFQTFRLDPSKCVIRSDGHYQSTMEL